MGAETFVNRVTLGSIALKTKPNDPAQVAFRTVVAQAQYDHGHAGYTGTVAEKNSFVFIKKVKTIDEAYVLADKLIETRDPRIDDKWGPAGCIEVEKPANTFVFFGTASS